MRIVLSGIFYPMAILRYFEAALKRRDDVELVTVGPWTGSWIPWNGGMNLPAKYAACPTITLPTPTGGSVPRIPIAYVEKQLLWEPDLWLQIDAGFHLVGRPRTGKNIIVATDPHVLNYDRQRTGADTFYCMQTPYAREGDEYLPYAYDPIWHAPERQEQRYDVALIGLHYDNRNKLMSALKVHGLKCYYDLGPSFDEARTIYNQSYMGLNWSSLLDLTARVFELLGMGRLAIVNDVPDLRRHFRPGVDLITFNTLDEAIEKVLYYRDNPEAGRKIARIGRETVRPHTWDARIERILNDL